MNSDRFPRPAIIGCRTPEFPDDQIKVIKELNPFGLIIFGEACRNGKKGVKNVVRQFRDAVDRDNAPILIDNEGGKVFRFNPDFDEDWYAAPPARRFGAIYQANPDHGKEAVRLNAQLIAADMIECGVTVNCAPVVDILYDVTFTEDALRKGDRHTASADMQSRCFGFEPDTVIDLGWYFSDGLMSLGVTPILKHIPGIGRMTADPHYTDCRVDTPLEELAESDFKTFAKMTNIPVAMTSHAIYSDIDPDNAATLSPKLISEVIRGHIGFEGVLLADALEMNAIKPEAFHDDKKDPFGMGLPKKGALKEITREALSAGIDLVLHCDCSGNFDHTVEVLKACDPVDGDQYKHLQKIHIHAKQSLKKFNRPTALKRLQEIQGLY